MSILTSLLTDRHGLAKTLVVVICGGVLISVSITLAVTAVSNIREAKALDDWRDANFNNSMVGLLDEIAADPDIPMGAIKHICELAFRHFEDLTPETQTRVRMECRGLD